jgi:DNA-binding NarL/FixJ family response regulator
MIRLLIVGDQPGVCKGLQMRLAAETDLSVVGEATDTQAALEMTTALRPDAILMDGDTSRLDGIATTSSLHVLCPQTSIIMLSFQDDEFTRQLAEQAGAVAFVVKSMPVDALLATIRQIAC